LNNSSYLLPTPDLNNFSAQGPDILTMKGARMPLPRAPQIWACPGEGWGQGQTSSRAQLPALWSCLPLCPGWKQGWAARLPGSPRGERQGLYVLSACPQRELGKARKKDLTPDFWGPFTHFIMSGGAAACRR